MTDSILPEDSSPQSAAVSRTPRSPKRGRGFLYFLRDLLIIVVLALGVSWVVKTYLVRSFYIPSQSMEDTLQINDRILVEQLTGKFLPIQRGDILVFKDPGGWLNGNTVPVPERNGFSWFTDIIGLTAPDDGSHLIKRVLGLPGDVVE